MSQFPIDTILLKVQPEEELDDELLLEEDELDELDEEDELLEEEVQSKHIQVTKLVLKQPIAIHCENVMEQPLEDELLLEELEGVGQIR